ncbi:erythromycin esterase-like protein [Deinobacterium chartae]|uniref:Erythromycin esterase-like protein n=1 Tax=Deinobacterium chartae TaxID=521158 RepID=A0A841HV70_9DEIO|nr:erythromycin esterase family protein [Deinobacterium chartae]MBB6097381.1 erythromycin esterase-like protein [Deinobacterium chartae]
MNDTRLAEAIHTQAQPVLGASSDYDLLIKSIGDAQVVLLGEASHGTHEFYRERARITRRLIEECGFGAVAVEADWPDAYRVNRYVRGQTDGGGAQAALEDFQRFPRWMWRNEDVEHFIDWLRGFNATHTDRPGVGFYGLDLYSLHRSLEEVVRYLDGVDPEAARRARDRFACFEHFGEDPQNYGYATSTGMAEPCEDAVVTTLIELQRREDELTAAGGALAEDEHFFAEQNARLARNAERYYRSMFRGRQSSWNLRDTHMMETLEALREHLGGARVVVWAHNSHLGDARATQMGRAGELNLGQLVRERYGDAARLVGFSTFEGTVTAANDWDEPARLRRVRPGLEGSYEWLFHQAGAGDFWLDLRRDNEAVAGLHRSRLQRAIGVVYRPETERYSHYFETTLPQQFDLMLHFDRTSAVVPLDRDPGYSEAELPDTYPSGI